MINTDSTFSPYETLILSGYKNDIFEIINSTKHYIIENDCESLRIDISGLNMLDAVKLSVLCSTFHFSKYPKGEIVWLVKDEMTKRQIQLLKLDNVDICVKKPKNSYVDLGHSFNRFLRLCK